MILVPDKDVLVSLYNDEKLTMSAIGDYFGCSITTVSRWFKMHGIKRKSRTCNARIKNVAVMHADRSTKSVCRILRDHAHDLRDDQERLSTDFMKNLIGVSCND